MSLLIALMASLFALVVPPAPAVQASAVQASAVQASAPAATPDPRIEARADIRALVAGVQQIERIRARTPADPRDGSCVDEKLAEARAGLQIAAAELTRLDESLARRDTNESHYALHRLSLLLDRAGELTRAARVCATEELSTIDTTKVEVEISPSVPSGDPTAPPSAFQRPERPPQQ